MDEGLRRHMLRIYNYMGIGVGLTGVVAWLVATTPALFGLFFLPTGGMTLLGMVALFSPLVFVLLLPMVAMRSSAATLQGLFWLFCGLMGISMASIFLVYTGESIARTFFIVAAMFGATSLYGYTTKKNLANLGSFFIMGLIGLLLVGIVNLFLHSTALQFVYSVAGVIIFTGLTAYDTQNIKRNYAQYAAWAGGQEQEAGSKLAVFSALSLYLNFINLFNFMLRFMGSRRGS